METTRSLLLAIWLILLCCNSLANATVSFINDILSGSANDCDYMGGIRANFEKGRSKTRQVGLLFYTLDNLGRNDVVTSDRPYANLLFVTRSKEQVSEHAITRLTISGGVIGTRLGSSVYRTIHDVTACEEPNGSDNQVSDGGELKFRPGRTRCTPLTGTVTQLGNISLTTEAGASVGYATNASTGIALRLLKEAQWWGEDRNEFLTHLDEPQRQGQNGVFGGLRIRAIGYNALLQGQFVRAHTQSMQESSNALSEKPSWAWPPPSEAWTFVIPFVRRAQSLMAGETRSGAACRSVGHRESINRHSYNPNLQFRSRR